MCMKQSGGKKHHLAHVRSRSFVVLRLRRFLIRCTLHSHPPANVNVCGQVMLAYIRDQRNQLFVINIRQVCVADAAETSVRNYFEILTHTLRTRTLIAFVSFFCARDTSIIEYICFELCAGSNVNEPQLSVGVGDGRFYPPAFSFHPTIVAIVFSDCPRDRRLFL